MVHVWLHVHALSLAPRGSEARPSRGNRFPASPVPAPLTVQLQIELRLVAGRSALKRAIQAILTQFKERQQPAELSWEQRQRALDRRQQLQQQRQLRQRQQQAQPHRSPHAACRPTPPPTPTPPPPRSDARPSVGAHGEFVEHPRSYIGQRRSSVSNRTLPPWPTPSPSPRPLPPCSPPQGSRKRRQWSSSSQSASSQSACASNVQGEGGALGNQRNAQSNGARANKSRNDS